MLVAIEECEHVSVEKTYHLKANTNQCGLNRDLAGTNIERSIKHTRKALLGG
jgi:hypothetical protein